MRRHIAGGAIAALVFSACAAEQANKAPASPQDVSPSTSVGAPNEPPGMARERAKNELEQARIELEQAGSDCSRACKALASMERATDHLCSVLEDKQSCDDARQKLQSSRDRVRGACGECQH